MLELGPLVENLTVTAAVALGMLLATWVVSARRNLYRLVDVAWGVGFAAVAATIYLLSVGHGDPVRRALLGGLTIVWGLRLAGHIAWRARGHGEDRRYVTLLWRARGSRAGYALRMVFLLQAAILWFVSLPLQVGSYATNPANAWPIPGAALWVIGSCSRPSVTTSSCDSAPTRTTQAAYSTAACGATPATPTISATPASGGGCG
jgi:steroid 5-alpha reductase family enzyme